MAKTITQCLVDGLLASGHVEIQSKSGKYRTFVHREAPEGRRYFVGKSGGLRKGYNVTDSISMEGRGRDQFINLGAKL